MYTGIVVSMLVSHGLPTGLCEGLLESKVALCSTTAWWEARLLELGVEACAKDENANTGDTVGTIALRIQ